MSLRYDHHLPSLSDTCVGFACDGCGCSVLIDYDSVEDRALWTMRRCRDCADAEIREEFETRTGASWTPSLVRGGQGRSAPEVEASSRLFGYALLVAAALVIAVLAFA